MDFGTRCYQAGQAGDYAVAQELMKSNHQCPNAANMLLMGATDVSPPHNQLASLALEHGASVLFGFTQAKSSFAPEKGSTFFNRVSMLKGPGDVAKGSFSSTVLSQ